MKKNKLIITIISIIVFISVPIIVFAQNSDVNTNDYNEYLALYDLSFFEKSLDKDTYTLLKDLGIEDFNIDTITALNFDSFKEIFTKIIRGKVENPIKSSLVILCLIILSSFFQSFKTTLNDSMAGVYSTISSLIVAVILSVKVSSAVSVAASAIALSANFIYAFIPIFGAIVASSGGITTSFSTNSLLLVLAQGLSFISSTIFIPAINCFLALGICSGLRSELNLGKLMATLKKCITSIISFCAAAFVSILSIKTAVASRADALGLRSIRFAINSVVPVIGSAISEGLLSIQSYSSLIKSSVGVVGIIAVALVFLPSFIEIVSWRLFISLCSICSDVFGDNSVTSTLNAFKDTLLLINVVLILSMVTTVISIGILIAAKTG